MLNVFHLKYIRRREDGVFEEADAIVRAENEAQARLLVSSLLLPWSGCLR
jgi:hypothetical protein